MEFRGGPDLVAHVRQELGLGLGGGGELLVRPLEPAHRLLQIPRAILDPGLQAQ